MDITIATLHLRGLLCSQADARDLIQSLAAAGFCPPSAHPSDVADIEMIKVNRGEMDEQLLGTITRLGLSFLWTHQGGASYPPAQMLADEHGMAEVEIGAEQTLISSHPQIAYPHDFEQIAQALRQTRLAYTPDEADLLAYFDHDWDQLETWAARRAQLGEGFSQ